MTALSRSDFRYDPAISFAVKMKATKADFDATFAP
jgi:hypothetical protein